MPSEFDGESGFPKITQSRCFAYNGVDTYSSVTIYPTYSGNLSWAIGTADSITGSITWQSVNIQTLTTLSSPNKALFYKVTGDSGSYLTYLKIKYG